MDILLPSAGAGLAEQLRHLFCKQAQTGAAPVAGSILCQPAAAVRSTLAPKGINVTGQGDQQAGFSPIRKTVTPRARTIFNPQPGVTHGTEYQQIAVSPRFNQRRSCQTIQEPARMRRLKHGF